MTRKRRIYTDFLVLVSLIQSYEKTVSEWDHQIREDLYNPCHPCAIAQTQVSMPNISASQARTGRPYVG